MLYRAYIDESGDEPSGGNLFAVGGFVGSAGQWEGLEGEWLAALPTGLDCFHATDCFGGRGQLDGVRLPDRVALLDRLTDVLAHYPVGLVCCGIDVKAYRTVAPRPRQNEFLGNKYVAAFEGAIEMACCSWPLPDDPSKADEQCAFVMESNEYTASAQRAFQRLTAVTKHPTEPTLGDHALWFRERLGGDTYGDKKGPKRIVLLQVADLGAFLGAKKLAEARDGKIPWRPYYEKLRVARRVHRLAMIDERSIALRHDVYVDEQTGSLLQFTHAVYEAEA
jgi:hypothetical protein